jgi:hypothetical protein
MTVIELRKKLIGKINRIKNDKILEEIYRLIENEETDLDVYLLSTDQKNAIAEAQQQIKNGDYLTDEQADKEIDEWLNK